MGSKKDVKQLIKELERQGFDVKQRKNGHYEVRKDGVYVTDLAGTPSDWRGLRNAKAALKRHGFIE